MNPLNAELNPICHLLALLGAHHILHISRIRVKYVFVRGVQYWGSCHMNPIGRRVVSARYVESGVSPAGDAALLYCTISVAAPVLTGILTKHAFHFKEYVSSISHISN